MKIIPINEVNNVLWNDFCGSSDQAWLFHRYEWIQREIGLLPASNESFAIFDNSRIVAIHPLYFSDSGTTGKERLLHSGIHRHTGLAVANDLLPHETKAVQRIAMKQLFAIADRHNADRIQLNFHNAAPANSLPVRDEIPFWVSDYGFHLGLHFSQSGYIPVPAMSTCNADQIVRLADPEDDLFRNLDEACRRAVRKAQKNSLVFTCDIAESIVSEYYRLAELSAGRTGESLPSIDYYQSLYDALAPEGRCKILFAVADGKTIGALFLLLYKETVNFMAGVSDPDYLPLRVNDFMHWSIIVWAKNQGYHYYRLGPIFPELPDDWPIVKVSRFKGKFGGKSIPIIQGSYFLKPEKYLDMALDAVRLLCTPKDNNHKLITDKTKSDSNHHYFENFAKTLAPYGLRLPPGSFRQILKFSADENMAASSGANNSRLFRPTHGLLATLRKKPVYKPLLNRFTLSESNITSLLQDDNGFPIIACCIAEDKRRLLLGLDVDTEITRYRQGDPGKVAEIAYKGGLGFDYERPNYLYEDQLDQQKRTEPWADNLGFMVTEQLARITGIPLIEPLPDGLKGLVILTGDDDQAYLEKYAEQLKIIGDTPITYFLHPLTKHTPETLAKLPLNVEIGVHPDALETPEKYDLLCAEQTCFARSLSGKPVRTVRNHGFLNDGYWGHLKTWESCGLELDVNLPGVDGTALNGSFLPFKVQRSDGTWSDHYSLLTAFGDGMVFALGMSDKQAARRISQVARQIERKNPGVLVFNLHPQNIDSTRKIHEEVVCIAHRKGWRAMGLESYLNWLRIFETLSVERNDHGCTVRTTSDAVIEGVVLKVPLGETGWKQIALAPWSGSITVTY